MQLEMALESEKEIKISLYLATHPEYFKTIKYFVTNRRCSSETFEQGIFKGNMQFVKNTTSGL